MRARGFTMIELLIVFALVAIAGAFALFVSMDTLRASTLRSDRNLYVSALQRARAQAMNNICASAGCADGKAHGVKIESDGRFIIFEGASFASRDQTLDSVFRFTTATTTDLAEVVFAQLSGNSANATIHLSGEGHTSDISVSTDGRISWTN